MFSCSLNLTHQGWFPGDVVTYFSVDIQHIIQHISIFHVPQKKHFFWENLQLKPLESISAYFLTTDKAIVTKLDQTIKEIELYKNLEFGNKGGVTRVTWPSLLLKFWDLLHISKTDESRNFKFGMQIGHLLVALSKKNTKLGQKGLWRGHVATFEILEPPPYFDNGWS